MLVQGHDDQLDPRDGASAARGEKRPDGATSDVLVATQKVQTVEHRRPEYQYEISLLFAHKSGFAPAAEFAKLWNGSTDQPIPASQPSTRRAKRCGD